MKATLKNTVGNVYQMNNNGEFSSKTKKLVKNSNAQGNYEFLSTMNSNKKNSLAPPTNTMSNRMNSNSISYPKPSFSIMNLIVILLVIFIFLMITTIIVFKDRIIAYTKSFINDDTKDEDNKKDVNDLKERIAELEEKNKSMQIKTQEQVQKQKQIKKKKVDTKSFESYDPKQQVKSDGYCYIGYDNGIRECAPVYEGDVCISGEQFPRMDKCMVPKMIA